MIKAIFFDLDNTLIQNPPFQFVKAYVEKLTAHLHANFPEVNASGIENSLRTAIRTTIVNQDPLVTNAKVFFDNFSSMTGLKQDDLYEPLDIFYKEIYPSLKSLTKPKTIVPQLVHWLMENDYAIAITTNPLFEHGPIEQRLGWAGLHPNDWEFAFVTSLNNCHFAKPHQMYYEEVMARIGVEPEETLMVGDDWQNDIVPAALCGMNTFWVAEAGLAAPSGDLLAIAGIPDGRGSLDDLYQMVTNEGWLDKLYPRMLTKEQIVPRMIGNIATLMGMAQSVPDHFWHQHPLENEWSPIEIITHLRDSERDSQRPRIERILKEDNPFLSSPQPPPAPGKMVLTDNDGVAVALDFARERQITIRLLEGLTEAQWIRVARHSVLGPTSLLEMVAFTARHDHLHINQLCQTLGNCE